MTDTEVLIVGAGPTGLALATALQARDVDARVVDRLAAGANTSRAAVVNARTLEVLEELGVAERLVGLGIHAPRFTIRDRQKTLIPVDFSTLPTRYPFSLMVPQCTTEQVLLDRLAELGGKVIRPKTLTRVTQDGEGAAAHFDDGSLIATIGGSFRTNRHIAMPSTCVATKPAHRAGSVGLSRAMAGRSWSAKMLCIRPAASAFVVDERSSTIRPSSCVQRSRKCATNAAPSSALGTSDRSGNRRSNSAAAANNWSLLPK